MRKKYREEARTHRSRPGNIEVSLVTYGGAVMEFMDLYKTLFWPSMDLHSALTTTSATGATNFPDEHHQWMSFPSTPTQWMSRCPPRPGVHIYLLHTPGTDGLPRYLKEFTPRPAPQDVLKYNQTIPNLKNLLHTPLNPTRYISPWWGVRVWCSSWSHHTWQAINVLPSWEDQMRHSNTPQEYKFMQGKFDKQTNNQVENEGNSIKASRQ